MLENRWARQYLKALFESRGQSLKNVPEFLAASGVDEIEDLLLEVRADRYGGSAIKGENCAIAALALCSEDAPIALIAELIESREVCYSAHRKARERLPELERAVAADPTDVQKLADLGFGLNALDEDEAALSALTRALAHAENMSIGYHQRCLNSIGWIHLVRGQYDDALGWLGLALGLSQVRETPDEEEDPDEGAAFEVTYRLALENMLVTLTKLGRLTEATAPIEEYHNCFGRLPDYESRSLTGLGLNPDVIFISSSIRKLSTEGSPTHTHLPSHFEPRHLRNRWAREYLTALERSNRTGLEDLPGLAAGSGMEDIEDPLVELRFLRESPLKALRLAIAALACCSEEAPNALVAELIETIETCYWRVEATRQGLPKLKAVLEEGSPNSEKIAQLGFALNALDEREAALAAFTKALEHPDTMSYYAHRDCLNNIGWDHYLRGEYEEALGWFEHACRLTHSPQQVGAEQEVTAQEASDNATYKLALENMLLALARLGRIREAAIRLDEYHDCFGRLPKYESLVLEKLGMQADVVFVRSCIGHLPSGAKRMTEELKIKRRRILEELERFEREEIASDKLTAVSAEIDKETTVADKDGGKQLYAVFGNRTQVIAAAKEYFATDAYRKAYASRKTAVERIRALLHFDDGYNFDEEEFRQFFKIRSLGHLIPIYRDRIFRHQRKLQEALTHLVDDGAPMEDRLASILKIHGVGINLASKVLAVHDPGKWPVFNFPVEATLRHFGYRAPKGAGTVARYLRFAELMQEFRVDCGAPDMLALDAFFLRFYVGKLKAQGAAD